MTITTIKNKLSKMRHVDLVDRVEPKVGHNTCHYQGTGTLGAVYLDKVVRVFVETVLPDDEDDIKMVVKNRDDQRWGIDPDFIAPYKSPETAISLGLLNWEFTVDEESNVTANQILVAHLKTYTKALVEVLCEAAIEAYEEGEEPQYIAIINVPGYSPMAEEPAEFETIAEAWQYLAEERRRSEDEDESTADYSDTVKALGYMVESPKCDSVYGPTPGYDGDHDLGLVYTVTHKQD